MNGEHAADAPPPKFVTHVAERTTTLSAIHTSTPKVMDGIQEHTYLQGLDNDSGYVSHNHESNFEGTQPERLIVENPVFVSEDTLLEKPRSQNNPEVTESVYEEFTNVYYLNTILDSSGGTCGMNFSGLQDSSASSTGLNISPELKPLEPIVTNNEKLSLFPPVNDSSNSAFLIDNDSNGENDPNLLNNSASQKLSLKNRTPQKKSENFDRSLTPQKSIFSRSVTPKKVSSLKSKSRLNLNNSVHNLDNTLLNSNRSDILGTNVLKSSNSSNILQNSICFQNSNNVLQNTNCFQNSNNVLQNSNCFQNSNNALQGIEPFSNSCKDLNSSNLYHNANNVLQNSNKINILNNSCNAGKKITTPVRKRKRSTSRTPQKQHTKSFNSDYSPDMFSDEEVELPVARSAEKEPALSERYVLECDKCLVKRVGETLGGVLPPPSFTTFELSVGEMLEKIKENGDYFWEGGVEPKGSTLLVNTSLEGCLSKGWPEVLEERFHGLHHNRSKLSEELESLCSKYSQRYVGAETQSSCTVFDVRMSSPSKRKSSRLRWAAKSPGRRLSHLARRRITFSSANLQAGVAVGGSSRQVMMDARRYELLTRKSPRKNKSPRKTPRKSPRKAVRTPKSSAKKRLMMGSMDEAKPGPSSATLRASATKRALFQSPDKKLSLLNKSKNMPSVSNPTTSPWKKKLTPKRALFCSPSKISPTNKRKRLDSDDTMPTKIARSLSVQSDLSGGSSSSNSMAGINRLKTSRSDSNLNSYHTVELSANHKKKLQWAVYEALRSQNIGVSHPQFKQFATVLARVTRKLLPNPATTVKTEGTSERMLRIAKRHVFAATKGKSVDEIIQAYDASRVKAVKPSGYVSKEAAAAMDVSVARSRDSVFQDKANTLNRESSNDMPAAKNSRQMIGRPENKIERVKKIINFDDDGSRYSFR